MAATGASRRPLWIPSLLSSVARNTCLRSARGAGCEGPCCGGGVRRAYADLREYADVGGRREPLVAPGEKLATADMATAQVLLARRLEQLDALRRGRALHGLAGQATLAAFAQAHLVAKAESQKFTEQWLAATEKCLGRAIEFFGADLEL